MKNSLCLFAVVTLMFFFVMPVFSSESAAIKNEISEQSAKAAEGADTFWTGLAVGAVGAAVLVPVSFLFKDKESKEYQAVLIAAAGVGAASLICIAWGGLEWIAAAGRIDELKKKENLTVIPYINPCGRDGMEIGLVLGIEL